MVTVAFGNISTYASLIHMVVRAMTVLKEKPYKEAQHSKVTHVCTSLATTLTKAIHA